MQKFLGKETDDITWLGSPAIPEQLLAIVQSAILKKGMPDWNCPPAPRVVELIARVRKMAQTAEEILASNIDATERTQEKIEDLQKEKTSIKQSARAFRAGTWEFLCQAALHEEIDGLIEDIESAIGRALRVKRARSSVRSSASRTPQRITIEKEKSEDEAPISAVDSINMN